MRALLLILLLVVPTLARPQTPLTDLGTGTYSGFQGGLYTGGVNTPPLMHLDRALDTALLVRPRDLTGVPDDDGAIVLVAIGMSNTNQEFAVFERQEDAAADRHARVVLLDGALGGQDALVLANPLSTYWDVLDDRIAAMGLAPEQVQVAWLKEAVQGSVPPFPTDALDLRGYLESIVQNLHDKFPNLVLCYLSSRIYGGYATGGEPKAYDTGFAVKWLIEDQIAGDPGLNDGRVPGPVEAPLLLWGPYLWANGTTPRTDGLAWLPGDIESDGVHPAASGEQKVADLLSAFFDAEITAKSWWTRRNASGLLAIATPKDAHVDAASPGVNFGSDPRLEVLGGALQERAYLGFALPVSGLAVERAKLSLRVPTDALGGGVVRVVPDTSWTEGGITWSTQPAPGGVAATVPQSSRDGTLATDVTADVDADADGLLSFVIAPAASGATAYHAREAGQPPRLVLTLSCAGSGPAGLPDADGDGLEDVCDCQPGDPTATGVPVEIGGLGWSSPTELVWTSGASLWGSATVYDVMSGDLADVATFWPSPDDLCLGTDLAIPQVEDTTPPPAPGTARFYLVQPKNPCGEGRWATATSGRDRAVDACR